MRLTTEVTRTKAASMFQPPVTVRTLQNYLELAKIFLPSFRCFEDEFTGGINRFCRLSPDHIPVLQRMMDYCYYKGLKQLRIELSNNHSYFEQGATTNDNYQGNGSKDTYDHSQEITIRVREKVS